MTRAFVSVGSNIEPEENTEKAVRLLDSEVRIIGISTIYLTEAEGQPEQPKYYNSVVEIETDMPPVTLKHDVLRRIENELGRLRNEDKFAPRTIDLDLILYNDLIMATEDLTLPDPDIVRRPFLAIPLHELAPGLVLPGSGLRIDDVASAMKRQNLKPLASYTEHIRKEVLHERKQ